MKKGLASVLISSKSRFSGSSFQHKVQSYVFDKPLHVTGRGLFSIIIQYVPRCPKMCTIRRTIFLVDIKKLTVEGFFCPPPPLGPVYNSIY